MAQVSMNTPLLEVCAPQDAQEAAMEGYCVPEEEQAEEMAEWTVEYTGDYDLLSETQKRSMGNLKEAMVYAGIKLKRVSLSFSGASVFFFSPSRRDGMPMPSSVLKFDTASNIKDEISLTIKYASLFGLTTPKVKDEYFPEGALERDPSSVMQIDLCGGIFGLPEFATAPAVHTFASVIEKELGTAERKVDVVPMVNEALERRMHVFTMSTRAVLSVKLGSMYKLTRFVGHGVLNRAKEGAERKKKSPALAAGFLNPPTIDELDPTGHMMQELTGRRKTIKDFFKDFITHEKKFDKKFQREVVCGLCHNDLHGGNLLLDSQGLVWLIDFATVKNNVHVLMDLSKFMASCMFLYLRDAASERHLQTFAKLLFTTPDATTALPLVGGADLKQDGVAVFILELLARLRHCMCIYEIGDDAPTNDGVPFALALFSWSVRMLSYSEPSLPQKTRAVYYSLVGALRVLWEVGVDVGPTAIDWIEQFRTIWEGQKGRRLSTSAKKAQVVTYEFDVELPRYLAQVGTAEAWSTELITREKVNVCDHFLTIETAFSGRLQPRHLPVTKDVQTLLRLMEPVHRQYLPQIKKLDYYRGRMIINGDAGSGKTMLTKQLFAEVSAMQLKSMQGKSMPATTVLPVRIPCIELARLLEADPDLPLLADPVNDLLARYVTRKYGQDSVPQRLILDVRNAVISLAMRQAGLGRPLETQQLLLEATGESSAAARRPSDTGKRITALLILFDGLDEAANLRDTLIDYVKNLMESEPGHLCIMTSRPSHDSPAEVETLQKLGFQSFHMGNLSKEMTVKLVRETFQRLRETEEMIARVCRDVCNDAYSSLSANALTLTLLIHVLRRYYAGRQLAGEEMNESKEADIMNKAQVYQRALKLILHQSDAAKFQMRDGKHDQEMVRRLDMLKSSRARKVFQTLCWHQHTKRTRSQTWEEIKEVCGDLEIVTIIREAFEAGRLPILEKVESVSGESQVQMSHLSFQELMSGEYASAIIRHAHAQNKTRAFMNYFLSSSPNNLDRERLSENWWVQVWFYCVDMLSPEEFEEWCDILAEDNRVRPQVGMCCIPDFLHLHYATMAYTRGGRTERGAPWESNIDPRMRVTEIDWKTHTFVAEPVLDTCLKKTFVDKPFKESAQDRWPLSMMGIRIDGVANLLKYGVIYNHTRVVNALLSRGVHYSCHDSWGVYAVTYASLGTSAMTKLFSSYGADFPKWPGPMHGHLARSRTNASKIPISQRTYRDFQLTLGQDAMRLFKPTGAFQDAVDGTLFADRTRVPSPNMTDPETGVTLLMCAAGAGHAEIVRQLLSGRADVNAETTVQGYTALNVATDVAPGTECMRLLLEAKADVNHVAGRVYNQGRPGLINYGLGIAVGMHAARNGDVDKVETLVEFGYDLDATNDLGLGILHFATSVMDNDEMLRRLLELNAKEIKAVKPLPPNFSKALYRLRFWDSRIGVPGLCAASGCLSVGYLKLFAEHGFDLLAYEPIPPLMYNLDLMLLLATGPDSDEDAEVLEMLLASGVQLDEKIPGMANDKIVFFLLFASNEDFRWLLHKQVDLNKKVRFGWTRLKWCRNMLFEDKIEIMDDFFAQQAISQSPDDVTV